MKKLLALSLLPLALLPAANAAIVEGDIIGIDFGTLAPTGSNTFNQFDAFNNSIADGGTLVWSTLSINSGVLKNTAGDDVTGIGFSVLNESGQNTSRADVTNGSAGPAPFDANGIYQDSIISNDQGAAPLDDEAYFIFTFTGLEDSLTYDLFGGYDGNNNNFDTTWSFDSGSSGISDTQNDAIASFLSTQDASGSGYHTRTGLQTDGSGNLRIQLTKSLHLNAGALTLTAVPEPGTYALLAGCFALAAVMVRRRK